MSKTDHIRIQTRLTELLKNDGLCMVDALDRIVAEETKGREVPGCPSSSN
jgi:hypothetical protein